MISEIVSIDIGFQNAAWVHVDKDKQVLGWSRAEILKPKPYNPAVFRPLVSSCYVFLSLFFYTPSIISACQSAARFIVSVQGARSLRSRK